MRRTRGLADRVAGLYRDPVKKQAFYDWAVRLRRVWKPDAPAFTPEQLAVSPPPDDDVFSYLIAEATAFLESGESFETWSAKREATIRRLERRGNGQMDPVRDAFYVYLALRNAGSLTA